MCRCPALVGWVTAVGWPASTPYDLYAKPRSKRHINLEEGVGIEPTFTEFAARGIATLPPHQIGTSPRDRTLVGRVGAGCSTTELETHVHFSGLI